ncbi:MAG: hypothetical protein ABEJ57_03255 [Halobacteriaceae archaeon]
MVPLNETTIAMAAAVLGVLFSIVYVVLGLYGIDTLREIRDLLADRGTD